jgi:anaerobic magnesium-protoporphyrin IX monomethyl ester cyclase
MENKVVLIRPQSLTSAYSGIYPPLSLLAIASPLEEKGYKVKIIDAVVEKDYYEIIEKETKDALIVGLTAMTSEIKNGIEILKFIKKKSPKIPTVLGGWHATLLPFQTCSDDLVDYVVLNEGEKVITELADALKENRSVDNIKGLTYSDESGKVKLNPSHYLDYQTLNPPAYHLVEMEQYISTTKVKGKEIRWFPYQASRGCPHRCTFCVNHVAGNFKYRMREPEVIRKELMDLMKRYKINGILFIDDNLFVNREKIYGLCKGIKGLGLTCFGECRADYFREGHVDEEMIKLAKEAGIDHMTIGAESGSPKILKRMVKDVTVEQIINSAKVCKKHGVTPDYSFIIGIPGETREDMFMTLGLIKTLSKICPEMTGGVNTYRPYPRSGLTRDCEKYGFKEPTSFKQWEDQEYSLLYTERTYPQLWQFDPDLVSNVSYFSTLYFSSNTAIKNAIKNFEIKRFPSIPFLLLARLRMRAQYFGFPLDKKLNKAYSNLKKVIYTAIKKRK